MGILTPPRGAAAATWLDILDAGAAIQAVAGDVERLSLAVDTAHLTAREGVAGLLDGPMAAAGQPVRGRALDWLQTSLVAGGAVLLWGYAVQAWADGRVRAYRRADWDSPFAVAPRMQALDAELDAVAIRAAATLATEPTATTITELYQAGVLPVSAPALFPGVDFGAVDYRALFNNLRDHRVFPPFFFDDDFTKQRLVEYLWDHPEDASWLAVLFNVPDLSGRELQLLKGLAMYDYDQLERALEDDDPDMAAAAADRLRDIDADATMRGGLNPAQRDYLRTFYDSMPFGTLATLSAKLGDTAPELRTPVANGLMHLTGPGATREDLSQVDPYLSLSSTIVGIDDPEDRAEQKELELREFTAFVDLMEAATVRGDPETVAILGSRAMRMSAFAHEPDPDADAQASRLLSVLARDPDAAAVFLAGPAYPTNDSLDALLGHRWQDDSGAAAVIRAVGDPLAASTDEGYRADAMRDLSELVGRDPVTYQNRLPEHLLDAVVDTGTVWLDAADSPNRSTYDELPYFRAFVEANR